MIKNARIAKIIVRFTYIFVLWVIAIHNLPFWLFGIVPRTHTNLTDGNQPLIAQTVYIHDMNVDLNVQLTAIGQTVCSFTVGISYSTAGCIFFTFILHACGQLQILKMHLENIFDEDVTKIDDRKIPEAIANNVRRHQRLIKFIATVEKVYHLMFLQQFIGITIALSTEEFLVISILVGDVEISTLGMIFCVFYTIYCAFMTLMYCSGGEFLIENSLELYSAAYNSRWYNSQRTYRKELTMIIKRAQKPMFITAGKFVPISLNTYARLIKTSASYMSVLLAAKS
uniref:Olfactory receptor 17 n=1 Tax=Meteorus pulchricornis TaxID=51522 RepID=A0A1S5VFK7_9HYME|nr:olfactory receptor 17 [Meteorus pulchricornis]